ncbi:hypothetical protein [Nocardia sp. GTS18]|uniref:hypothetical protein n=1 Tax=Nocardia sp. GTS18 TaxID=1778064 RepID=UPI002105CAC3|nr:hypothetical protein [Nocardia sp. GTS18]
MNSVVQQLITVAGVLLGAGATFAGAALTERAKWRRTQQSRWDDRRLVAYSEFAHALKNYSVVSMRMAAARGFPSSGQAIPAEEGEGLLLEADSEKTLKWEMVLLLGSPEAVAAARAWNKAVWELSLVARGAEISHEDYIRAFEAAGHKRNAFYECARNDLGVRIGELPVGDGLWLPQNVGFGVISNPNPVASTANGG